jgi:ABC-2 type transport system ATP-binding protein
MTSAAPAIACERLTKRFGPVVALRELSLAVPRGTLLGLLGPNGAGKTTLIRILLGLTPATSGSAALFGTPVPAPTVLPEVGYMPQNLAIYTDLKVGQNLALFGRLYGLPPERLEERTRRVLELVHLTERRRARVSELSGGMQRRVSLAAALLTDPQLLLLDEPTVGVDPELRAEFWGHFRTLAAAGKTIVMTTHYMEEAVQCDRVAMLHDGELLAEGTPAEVKARTGARTMDEAFLVLVRRHAPSVPP